MHVFKIILVIFIMTPQVLVRCSAYSFHLGFESIDMNGLTAEASDGLLPIYKKKAKYKVAAIGMSWDISNVGLATNSLEGLYLSAHPSIIK